MSFRAKGGIAKTLKQYLMRFFGFQPQNDILLLFIKLLFYKFAYLNDIALFTVWDF